MVSSETLRIRLSIVFLASVIVMYATMTRLVSRVPMVWSIQKVKKSVIHHATKESTSLKDNHALLVVSTVRSA